MPRSAFFVTCVSLWLVSFSVSAYSQDVIAKPKNTSKQNILDLFNSAPMPVGPVHEAFATALHLTPVPVPVAPEAPPIAINEEPNANKPAGDGVQWVDGYWVYDDTADRFLWVSGLWRKLPPGRQWLPSKWQKVDGGFRRIAGSWIPEDIENEQVATVENLPNSLEEGPKSAKPQEDAFWVPGSWEKKSDVVAKNDAPMKLETKKPMEMKEPMASKENSEAMNDAPQSGDYVWTPGMWSQAHENWIWVPSHYVWTPDGSRRVEGYWDYPWITRGRLNACCAEPTPDYVPQPLDTADRYTNLWTDTSTGNYYYGDYANRGYENLVPWHQYHAQNVGYDPLYSFYARELGPGVGGDFGGFLDSRYSSYGYRPRPLRRAVGAAVVGGAAAAALSSGGGSGAAATAVGSAATTASGAASAATTGANQAASAAASNAASTASSAASTAATPASNAAGGNAPASTGASEAAPANAPSSSAGDTGSSSPNNAQAGNGDAGGGDAGGGDAGGGDAGGGDAGGGDAGGGDAGGGDAAGDAAKDAAKDAMDGAKDGEEKSGGKEEGGKEEGGGDAGGGDAGGGDAGGGDE